jgi:hypothetical protein
MPNVSVIICRTCAYTDVTVPGDETVIRTQIQLTEQQSTRLHQAAKRSGVSVAEVIRRGVDQYLDQDETAQPGGTTRLAMLEIVGKWSCGLTDIADRHDDYSEETYLPPADAQGSLAKSPQEQPI